jgi:hypothetical protein
VVERADCGQNRLNVATGPMLHELLAAEDDAAILDFKCAQTGTILWPLIRMMFLRMIISDLYYGNSVLRAAPSGASAFAMLRTLGASTLHNAELLLGRNCRADVFLVATGLGNIQIGGTWLNRLCDHFASCLPNQTIIMEDLHEWKWPFPRAAQRVLLHAPLQARNQLFARVLVRDRHIRAAARLVRFVAERAQQHLNWYLGAERERSLSVFLARKAAALPHQYRTYERLLSKISPKIIVIEAACYGPSTALLAVAKSMGIITAEYQHGAISRGHDGYNIAPALAANSEYRKVLPEYFLGYGSWWNDQINVPVTKVTVGNPHRDWQLAQLARIEHRSDILLLGDGIDTEGYVSMAQNIAAFAAPHGFRTVFRPHPLERARLQSLFTNDVVGLTIDQSPDIYQALAAAYAVVSELSTGLFEAVGIADKVFLWDTPKSRFVFPDHPFQSFQTPEELVGMVMESRAGKVLAEGSDAIWKANWQRNYLDFLKTCAPVALEDGQ